MTQTLELPHREAPATQHRPWALAPCPILCPPTSKSWPPDPEPSPVASCLPKFFPLVLELWRVEPESGD